MMLAKNCWIVSTLVAATAAGHAAAQGGAVAKGATEPLNFKRADAGMRAMLAPVKDLGSVLEDDFEVALADLDGDGQKEIIVKSWSRMNCGHSGACATLVLQQRGKRMVVLANRNTFDPLALTYAKYGGYRALAFVDEKGRIEIGQQPGSGLYRKPMLYLMQPPKGAAAQR